MKYKVIDHSQMDLGLWQDYVNNNAFGTIFHTKHFYDMWSGIPGFIPFAYFVTDEAGDPKAMMSGYYQTVRKGIAATISTRAVIWQTPLYDDLAALECLMSEYYKLGKNKAVYTEIRNNRDDVESRNVYAKAHFLFFEHLNYFVDCSEYNTTWKRISEARRRQIKKGIASGVVINSNPSLIQVQQFYEILTDLYTNKVKKPLPPWEFFLRFYQLTIQYPMFGKYLLIEFDNQIIGGIMAPITPKKYIHELYVAGLDSKYKDQYPSILATWAAINYGVENNIGFFDFMGAGKPDDNYGVRDFKARFGGELVNYGRYTCIHSRLKMKIAETGFNIIQRLKG